jgi:tetratricopeptide (TPR) repeat protein
MPSETEKGVIKPLSKDAVPLIAWRLRDIAKPSSKVMMEGIYSCANCHSFSSDGKTMGMDLDGPQNDKGLYAMVPVKSEMSIRNEDVIAWSDHRGKLGGKLRVGFMSQVSPDGQYVVTTVNDLGKDQTSYQRRKNPEDYVYNYYVANFRDYRFLQVFYPTRGILAWYSRATDQLKALPGADDPRYVHTSAVWVPDGSYLVFSRAEAKSPYPPGSELAEYANDPREIQIKYDLYRIPFNGGKGGRAERIQGASRNGMSNSFPKVSPDGRWIVYVQSRNGQLMRPDSQLFIVPATGGQARRMRCNTPLMNSWHSFSPNGRWLVFSSKSRSPYTQMFLTHIDPNGNDSPAILIENSTAANRAVNIPEFVNISPDGMTKIEAPATDYYRIVDVAAELTKKGEHAAAVREWTKAVQASPNEALAHNNLGVSLAETGQAEEAVDHYRRALELDPDYPLAHNNIGQIRLNQGKLDEAIVEFRKALQVAPGDVGSLSPGEVPDRAKIVSNLGVALARQGQVDEAITHLTEAVEYSPEVIALRMNLGMALATNGRWEEAISQMEEAVRLSGGRDPSILEVLSRAYAQSGRLPEAIRTTRQALEVATRTNNLQLAELLRNRLAEFESGMSPKKQ